MNRLSAGIYLTELLIVLLIVGIITTAAIPSVISLIQTDRLKAAAEKLYYDLEYARSAAVKSNTTVYVSFQTGSSWCYGINSGSSCNCMVANNCNLGVTQTGASQQLSLATNGLSSNAIQFGGTHGAANTSGSVTFSLSSQSTTLVKVSVGVMGDLQMCSTNISGYAGC